MIRGPARRFRVLSTLVSLALLVAAAVAGFSYWKLRASLPRLDGRISLPGLSAGVSTTRDALGIPTIRGKNRPDLARALGFLHAQDRFFQMDAMRRRGAGELSEIFGSVTLEADRLSRIHGFRKLAQTILPTLPATDRAVLAAYTAGVNAGLHQLGEKPFEYLILRAEPAPWRDEDTLLVSFAMCLDLEESTGNYEHSLAVLRDQRGEAAAAFFAPLFTPEDAAIDRSTGDAPPMPTARQINLRAPSPIGTPTVNIPHPSAEFSGDLLPGSNSFALTSSRSATGAALLASDMHLTLRMPNTWYRASLEWDGHQVTGLSLPGTPTIVAGSNGKIAWGFTTAYVDRSDLVLVTPTAVGSAFYLNEGKRLEFEIRTETILVKGREPVKLESRWTIWGPVIGEDEKGHLLALRWVAHDPEATDFTLAQLETAADLESALSVAHRAGVVALNIMVAAADGRIGWTIAGRLPNRFGFDGRFPVPWLYGDRGWHGLLPPEKVPVRILPAGGENGPDGSKSSQLWTANNRVIGGRDLALLGDGAYAWPARAAQVRDDLSALGLAHPADLLEIQLDDRAIFLERWEKALLAALRPSVVAEKKSRGELRTLVEQWEGHAGINSVSYRLVQAWRLEVASLALEPIFEPCFDAFGQFNWQRFRFEGALWTMVQEKPMHLLSSRFTSWDDLLVTAADNVVKKLEEDGEPLSHATWGRRNTAQIRHPLAGAFPAWLTGWLNAPPDQLPGDSNLPRVQAPDFGASERMVVSPGHEDSGILQMPGGQSGHPLSPYYRAGHAAWVRGDPSPFLPGKTEHTLDFSP